ncbi:MAG: hypothetical protein DIU78_013055 [Pseudomonadota bacterium]|jgi:hypothetical protein
MTLPTTLFILADKWGVLPGRPFYSRDEGLAHIAAVDQHGTLNLELAEYRLVTPTEIKPEEGERS